MKQILLLGLNGRQRDVAEAVCNQYARKTIFEPNGIEPDLVVADVSLGEVSVSSAKTVIKIAKEGTSNNASMYYNDNYDLKAKLTEQLGKFGVK